MNDLDNMTAADARDWYQRWYVPNNATLVVVGDVDHQAVFREAARTYGAVPPALPARKPLVEPAQRGPQHRVKAPPSCPTWRWPGACRPCAT